MNIKKIVLFLFLSLGLSSCDAFLQGLADAYEYNQRMQMMYMFGPAAYVPPVTTSVPAYVPPPVTTGTYIPPVTSSGSYSSSSSSSEYSGSSSSNYSSSSSSRDCQRCMGTGKCQICNGSGRVYQIGIGHDGYCAACSNHNGKCSVCNGTGKM